MKTLQEVYESYQMADGGGDKGTAHSYIDIYAERISADEGKSLLEIGVWQGHSLKMWADYLPDSRIVGLDIDLSMLIFDVEGFEVLLCDATKQAQIKELVTGKFDYIIDDGSHTPEAQITALYNLWDYLLIGGKYFIEDVLGMDVAKSLVEKIVAFTGMAVQVYDLTAVKGRADDILIEITKVN
jgi:ABC-type amino acid transport substrate-binding protein